MATAKSLMPWAISEGATPRFVVGLFSLTVGVRTHQNWHVSMIQLDRSSGFDIYYLLRVQRMCVIKGPIRTSVCNSVSVRHIVTYHVLHEPLSRRSNSSLLSLCPSFIICICYLFLISSRGGLRCLSEGQQSSLITMEPLTFDTRHSTRIDTGRTRQFARRVACLKFEVQSLSVRRKYAVQSFKIIRRQECFGSKVTSSSFLFVLANSLDPPTMDSSYIERPINISLDTATGSETKRAFESITTSYWRESGQARCRAVENNLSLYEVGK